MDIWEIAGICLISVFVLCLVRNVNTSYVFPLTVFVGTAVLLLTVPYIFEIVHFSENLITKALSTEKVIPLFKGIGSVFLIQYVSELCVENGSTSLAHKIEFVGKVYLTLLCLPFLEEILLAVTESLN